MSITSKPSLLDLPDEIFLQIASYLEPDVRTGKDDGYGSPTWLPLHLKDPPTATLFQSAAETRQKHRESTQPLVNLALTCKRLAPIAQEFLFKNVSLPRQLQDREHDGFYASPMLHFLRTILEQPDLVKNVCSLAIWLWKGVPIRPLQYLSESSDHEPGSLAAKMADIVYTLPDGSQRSGAGHERWIQSLSCPSELMVASLILASSPQLRAVEIYAKAAPSSNNVYGNLGWFLRREEETGIRRLSQGLGMTSVQSLTLSTNLDWLCINISSLTHLTLDYNGRHPFANFLKGDIAPITDLTILWECNDNVDPLGRSQRENGKQLRYLCRRLKSLHTLRFNSSAYLLTRGRAPHTMERIVFQPADALAFKFAEKICGCALGYRLDRLRVVELHRFIEGPVPATVVLENVRTRDALTRQDVWTVWRSEPGYPPVSTGRLSTNKNFQLDD